MNILNSIIKTIYHMLFNERIIGEKNMKKTILIIFIVGLMQVKIFSGKLASIISIMVQKALSIKKNIF